jgi:enoyl-CoA hydratase/carnithine racemase
MRAQRLRPFCFSVPAPLLSVRPPSSIQLSHPFYLFHVMTEQHVLASIKNKRGFITLNRPQALNSLSLAMVRTLTQTLRDWRDDQQVHAVVIGSSSEKAFCAGGDIRFFHQIGIRTPKDGSALLEDFFSEEYALNYLIHHYPKPYIALMDGIVMGGGMGIAQGGGPGRLRVVTERTRMAMPEVNIGLFPDVGGSYFLSRVPDQLGVYLGLTGETIRAADALYAGLADVFIPAEQLPALQELLESTAESDLDNVIRCFAAPFRTQANPDDSMLASHRSLIERHFAHDDVQGIIASLAQNNDPFAQKTLTVMRKRSPLMMGVTLQQLRRGALMSLADCLRMERTMVRHCFEHGEVLEGVRALVIDKDNAPHWRPPSVELVTPEMVEFFFTEAWPAYAHPLRDLR